MTKTAQTGILNYKSDTERTNEQRMVERLKTCPIPDAQLLENLGLFLGSKNLSRILFMDRLYEQIVDVPGVVMEFGTRWGQNAALFSALRGIYEPFNRHRKIVAFDTFAGFPGVALKDGRSELMREGNLSTTDGYVEFLSDVLQIHEAANPLSHIEKFDLVAGDATQQLPKYLESNPHTIISLAYFDFDLYEPTRQCLELVRPRLVKGSVVGFDELNDPDSPGETLALAEVFGLPNVRLRRWRHASRTAYFVVE